MEKLELEISQKENDRSTVLYDYEGLFNFLNQSHF